MTSASYTINGSRYFARSYDRTHTASTGVFFALATSNAATTARDALAAHKSCEPDKMIVGKVIKDYYCSIDDGSASFLYFIPIFTRILF